MNRFRALVLRLFVLFMLLSGAMLLTVEYRLHLLINPFEASDQEFLTGFLALMAWMATLLLFTIAIGLAVAVRHLVQMRRQLEDNQEEPLRL